MTVEKVSIIISVYNTEWHLARCLDSVVGQTERNLEIICVNDGSTDGSLGVLTAYAAKDPRIRIIDRENGGLSAARNSALDVMTGEYVMFVDSDDWIPSDAVEKFLRVAKESGAPVVVSREYARNRLERPRKAEVRWSLERPALERLIGRRKMQSSVWNKFYRADAIRGFRFIEGIYFEDWPFMTELFGEIGSFALIAEPMYVYSTEGVSITRSPFSRRKAESYLAGIAHVTEFFRGRPDASVAARRIAIAVKMLVGKTVKSGDPEVRALVAAQDFSGYPLNLKTRFRLWRMRIWARRRG